MAVRCLLKVLHREVALLSCLVRSLALAFALPTFLERRSTGNTVLSGSTGALGGNGGMDVSLAPPGIRNPSSPGTGVGIGRLRTARHVLCLLYMLLGLLVDGLLPGLLCEWRRGRSTTRCRSVRGVRIYGPRRLAAELLLELRCGQGLHIDLSTPLLPISRAEGRRGYVSLFAKRVKKSGNGHAATLPEPAASV